MDKFEKKIESISREIEKGVTPKGLKIRDLLDLLGVTRRGSHVNRTIRNCLEKYRLDTNPDFEYAYLDGFINIVSIESDEKVDPDYVLYQINGLASANRKPLSIKPDSKISSAVTLMLKNEFSQLPVMTSDREPKGAITWKSIGSRLSLGRKCTFVRECMDKASIINYDSSLFSAISLIYENEYVLVQQKNKTISGIVTASDLSLQFKDLSEPFLLIGECESHLRKLIHGKFSVEELRESKNPNDESRTVHGVSDLTFGEYVRLLENEKRWKKVKIEIDRVEFINSLNIVREVRNDIMHFDPQGLDPDKLALLRNFTKFLQEIRRLALT